MRVVLDTNVLVAGLLWQGLPSDLLRKSREGSLIAFTSKALLAELTEVLGRPKFLNRIKAVGLTVDELVDLFVDAAIVVKPYATGRIVSDPDDDVVIGTPLAAHAEMIVTGDRALLEVEQYGQVGIASVAAAMRVLAPQ